MLAASSASTLQRILSAGILAPSADNRHLFRFSILTDRVVMKPDDLFRSADAQTRLLACISFGATVENIALEATCVGYSADIDWLLTEDALCEIRLVASDDPPDRLAQAISLRHTNQRFFSGPPLAPAEKTDLEREVSRVPQAHVTWLDQPAERRTALRLIRLAETERFRSRALHAELFSGLRFDMPPNSNCEQGIPIGAAEIDIFARPFFRLMRHWSVMRLLNVARAHSLIGLRAAYFPARLSPHLGVISAGGEIPEAAISAGRAFERFWLRATQLGMVLQPFAAAPLYARPEFKGVSFDTRAALQSGWTELQPHGMPLIAFRLGHAAVPSAVTGRPPLSHFLTTEPIVSGQTRTDRP